jgi:hypothetical protein
MVSDGSDGKSKVFLREKNACQKTLNLPSPTVTTSLSELETEKTSDGTVTCEQPDASQDILSEMTCSTRFDMYLCEEHQPAPDEDGVEFDEVGNMWCSKCHVQHSFMMLGADRGYPEVKNKKVVVVKAGHERWLAYAKTMGHQYVESALKLAQLM